MARHGGPRGLSPEQQVAHGESRPSRQIVPLYPDHASRPDPEHIPPPPGMTTAAKKIWARKVDRYRQRGQKVQGFEDGLRQYCELEASLNKNFKSGNVNVSMVNTYRMFCAEFFDTPASQRVPAHGGQKTSNPFTNNGKRAASE